MEKKREKGRSEFTFWIDAPRTFVIPTESPERDHARKPPRKKEKRHAASWVHWEMLNSNGQALEGDKKRKEKNLNTYNPSILFILGMLGELWKRQSDEPVERK